MLTRNCEVIEAQTMESQNNLNEVEFVNMDERLNGTQSGNILLT